MTVMKLFLSIASLVLALVTSISHGVENIAENNNRFALKLYRNVPRTNGNFFLSPFSIRAALAMTYGGSRNSTRTQLAKTLFISDSADGNYNAATFGDFIRELNKPDKKGIVEIVIGTIYE